MYGKYGADNGRSLYDPGKEGLKLPAEKKRSKKGKEKAGRKQKGEKYRAKWNVQFMLKFSGSQKCEIFGHQTVLKNRHQTENEHQTV